jgi:hypothetical protein
MEEMDDETKKQKKNKSSKKQSIGSRTVDRSDVQM